MKLIMKAWINLGWESMEKIHTFQMIYSIRCWGRTTGLEIVWKKHFQKPAICF